jgi:hypothetical protein
MILLIVAAAVCGIGGCKPSAGAGAGDMTELAFGGNDVNADGTLSPQAMKTLDQKSQDRALSLTFMRTRLKDAGLVQLGKYHNVRRITATGSAVTEAGIAKLKQALPEVEVTH